MINVLNLEVNGKETNLRACDLHTAGVELNVLYGCIHGLQLVPDLSRVGRGQVIPAPGDAETIVSPVGRDKRRIETSGSKSNTFGLVGFTAWF